MKRQIAILLILVFATIAFASCAESESDWAYLSGKDEFVIGYTLYAPMNYKDDNGELIGFDTEFAKALCEELGLTPKFVEINWDTKEVELNAKTIDTIWNGFTVNENRKKEVDFSIPYLTNKQVIVIKKSNQEKYKTIDDFADAAFSAEKKSAGEVAILTNDKIKDNKYTPADKQTDVLLEVKSGTSDAGVIDYVMAKTMLAEGTDYSDLVMIESIQLAPEEYAIGFRKASPETLKKVNEAIEKLGKSGKLEEIAGKYDLVEQLSDNLKK